jgi:hypothetical protein
VLFDVRQENSDNPKQYPMNEEQYQKIFLSELETLRVYQAKHANASMFLKANYNDIQQNKNFNKFKEYMKELEEANKQIADQTIIVKKAFQKLQSPSSH